MDPLQEASLLRIFVSETDRFQHKPLYESIVLKAKEMGLEGATVLRGSMGYGASHHIHTAKILELSMNLPCVIEIVDSPEKIERFLPFLKDMMNGGLLTLEKVRIIPVLGNL